MIGAIIGDVVGSKYEFHNYRNKDFKLLDEESFFTDDTVLTVAVMDWILNTDSVDQESLIKYFQKWGRKYPNAGYGSRFISEWLYADKPAPYKSYGNGSAMRISPIAYVANSKEELLFLSDLVTGITHNAYEGMKGARSIALATFMALHGSSKEEIKDMAISYYPQIANFDYEDLKKNYRFNETSQNTCPQALYCFLISKDFEDCLRTSVSIGGDTDTLCAMSCAIAEAYYKKIRTKLKDFVYSKLTKEMQEIVDRFQRFLDKLDDDRSLVLEVHYDLSRFVEAHKSYYEIAKSELKNGYKQSHWMWFMFPQIKGLGTSPTSIKYSLSGIHEASDYYQHDILGPHLLELCKIILSLKTNNSEEIFGYTDALKLKSSMTIFYKSTGEKIFIDVLNKYYKGELDQLTLDLLEKGENR